MSREGRGACKPSCYMPRSLSMNLNIQARKCAYIVRLTSRSAFQSVDRIQLLKVFVFTRHASVCTRSVSRWHRVCHIFGSKNVEALKLPCLVLPDRAVWTVCVLLWCAVLVVAVLAVVFNVSVFVRVGQCVGSGRSLTSD